MKGTIYKAQHKKTGYQLKYLVVKDPVTKFYRLVNMESFNIMGGFKGLDREDVVKYIENNLNCDIISEDKLLQVQEVQ